MFKQADSAIIKKMGMSGDQKGILKRYKREKAGWDFHLFRTKEYIITCMNSLKGNVQKALILGSGWLLDVPVDELLGKFERIDLVDIHHPKMLQKKYRENKKINFITADITNGVIQLAFECCRENIKLDSDKISKIPQIDISDYDFVVSLNLLNQLDILIVDFLVEEQNYSETEILNIRKVLQQYHLNILPSGKSCLITDYEEMHVDDYEKQISSKKLIYIDLTVGQNHSFWKWKFDASKLYQSKYNTHFNVVALSL